MSWPCLAFSPRSTRSAGLRNTQEQVIKNSDEADEWFDRLPWNLCSAAMIDVDSRSEDEWVDQLTSQLVHGNSSIRSWMLELGWMVRYWMDPSTAVPRLLKNLADTLAGPFESAGLAAALASTEQESWSLARAFAPLPQFAEQYRTRLKQAEDSGILALQARFWELEAQC